MSVTTIGLVLIPLGLLLFARSRKELLLVTVFFAPFSASAVVNFSSPTFGLQPGYLFGILYIARATVDHIVKGGGIGVDRLRLKMLTPFWLFVGIAALSIVAIPLRGFAIVTRPSGVSEVLFLSGQNITQFGYLVFMTMVLTAVATERLRTEDLKRILRVFIGAGIFACIWGWFEVSTFLVSGIEYPRFIFNNSVSFAQNVGTVFSLVGIRRISSIAAEPSMLARFLLVPCFIVIYDYFRGGVLYAKQTSLGFSILFVVTLLACASSTGYVGLAAGFGGLVLLSARDRVRSFLQPEAIRRLLIAAGGTLALGLFLLGAAILVARTILGLSFEDMYTLFDLLVLSKLESGSASTRIGEGLQALELWSKFPFFGAGWGSHRSFDLVTYVLGNTGLIGFLVFAYSHVNVMKKGLSIGWHLDVNEGNPRGPIFRSVVLGVGVLLFAKSVAEPDIIYLDQWILLGLLITGASAGERQLRASTRRKAVAAGTD